MLNGSRPEILAPAGGMEQLIAAVRCGADAVYLGAGGFNARQGAENFGGGRLAEAVSYAHARGVKVHVTVNTLVRDQELEGLDGTIDEIAASGADAVIIQDLAVNARFRRRCPDIPRHASTQMTVHNLDGALLAADLGFTRVVLARELTLREIEDITARCGIETEVFIHGALCMCMSGQCELSAMLGGRSGNRGYCAQPCRLNFTNGERDYALSLKDMSHIGHIRELAGAGVASFKIEGRMKRPEYVAAAVTAARQALAGEPYDEETLRAVFSRSGFTDGYLTGRRDVDMFGSRSREDVTAAAGVLGRLAGLYRAERQSVPVDMVLELDGSGSALTVTCGDEAVKVAGQAAEPARTRPLTQESAGAQLAKTGGTPYLLKGFRLVGGEGLTLPVSALNSLRRQALEELTRRRSRPRPWQVIPVESGPVEPHVASEEPEIRCRFRKAEQVPEGARFDRIILPMEELAGRPELIEMYGGRLIGELPALCFGGDNRRLSEQVERLRDMGLTDVICDTLYGVGTARRLGLRLNGGAGLNIANTAALEELQRLGLESATLSVELTMGQISGLGGDMPRGYIAYGRLPLMLFRACPIKRRAGCGNCPGQGQLTDRRGAAFPVICHGRRYGTLLNSVPLHIASRPMAGADFITLYFTLETPGQVSRTLEEYRRRAEPQYPRTGGLYYRGVK